MATQPDTGERDRFAPAHRIVEAIWSDTRWGVLVCMITAAVAAAIAGWWMPRGPVSTAQALTTMAIGLAVGLIAGAALRSRWALLLAPAVFVGVFEVVRMDAVGPTVDAIDLTSTIAFLASIGLRLFHGVLVILPMLLGVSLGRAWALRRVPGWRRPTSRLGRVGFAVRRGGAAVLAVVLILLAVAISRPATTDPILRADGTVVPGSVAEIATVEIGGHDQDMLIRGVSADNPVLLFLAGGPGGTELGTIRRFGGLLEQDFVLVTWDQRGTGSSYGAFEPASTMTIDRAVADTIEVSEYLRDRFDTEQIYLVGNSYGTFLGVLAAQQRPDLYAAFVGTGQMVNARETDEIFYADTLAYVERTGDTARLDSLRAMGPPPYDDPLDTTVLVSAEHEFNDYSAVEGHQGRREPDGNMMVPEYTWIDRVGAAAGLADTYAVLYPQLQDLDLRTEAPSLDVPVYLVEGRYEARGRVEPMQEWFDQLDAPSKQLITFDVSGHRPFVEEPERFHQVMTQTVLAETAPDVSPIPTAADPTAEPDNELLDLFARYNRATWPWHLVAYAAGLLVVGLIVRRPGRTTDRVTTTLLAAMWLWLGVGYLGRYAVQLDATLGAVYATMFIVQAGLFVRASLLRDRLRFTTGHGVAGWVGWSALGYALVVYPLLGIMLGHAYPQAPLFGMAPCPSTIATFGLLLLAAPPLPRHLLTIPMIWAVLAPLAAVGHGVFEDLGLFVFGVLAVVIVLVRDRHRDHAAPNGNGTVSGPEAQISTRGGALM